MSETSFDIYPGSHEAHYNNQNLVPWYLFQLPAILVKVKIKKAINHSSAISDSTFHVLVGMKMHRICP